MRLIRFVLFLGIVTNFSEVQAQPSLTIEWTQPNASPSEAQGYTYRYFLDNGTGVVIQSVLCGTVNNETQCSAPFPIPSIGTHTVYITGENEYGVSGPSPTLRFRYPAIPSAPSSLKVTKGGESDYW